MNELVHIGKSDISVKEYNGQRVVTFKDIDTVHQRAEGTARKRFNDNKRHLIEGEDYFVRKTDEAKEEYGIIAPNGLVLLTESGYLMLVKSFTDDLAWDVQRKLVSSYFKVKELASEELSPQMQLIMQMVNNMAQKELADKKRDRQIALAQETAEKAVETTERMKDEIISPFENWRDDINKKVRQISIASGIPYQGLFTSIYSDLEHIGRCDLSTRQRNKRDRMERAGCTKTDIQKETTKIAVIEGDARLKQIFEDIVRKYGMKYLA